MSRPKDQRNRRFRAALALAGMTTQQFAAQHEVTTGHLFQVLRGDRESASLTGKVDAFIQKHLISKNALVA